ncbi:MAG: peptidyl-prolyl cis-trans isomerase, partial [Pseudomonadota bacterium]
MMQMRSAVFGAVAGAGLMLTIVGHAACGKTNETGTKQGKGSAGQSSGDSSEVLAEIENVKITVDEFQKNLNKQSPYLRASYNSIERKKEFLDNMVRFEVLAKEAARRGLDKDPEVVRSMKQEMIRRLMKEAFDNEKMEEVPEEELRKYYDEHTTEYNRPEEVRVSAVVIKDKALAATVAGKAKSLDKQDAKAFRELVEKHSEDERTKVSGGDLRFFAATTTEIPAEVVKAAFELETFGDVAGPVQTGSGYYIIKQTGRHKATSKTFDEVKRLIQSRLAREKRTKAMDDFVADLKKRAN